MKTNDLIRDIFDQTFLHSLFGYKGRLKNPCSERPLGEQKECEMHLDREKHKYHAVNPIWDRDDKSKRKRVITPLWCWGKDTIIGVYNSYVDGLDIETISALFEMNPDDVNDIIDAINAINS